MKFRYLASIAATGAAAAPLAAAATTETPGGAIITQRDGHVHIDASPPDVSEPRSYGQWSTPAPFLFWD